MFHDFSIWLWKCKLIYRCHCHIALMWISFHFNFHSPPPERCHPLFHATWPWPAGRSKGLQPRLIGNLWHPLRLPIETNLSVFGDNLSVIQYLIVKWKFSSKTKEKQVLKKAIFSLFERKSMNPTSCTCPTAAWFCVSPTNQPHRDGDGTKTSSGIGFFEHADPMPC